MQNFPQFEQLPIDLQREIFSYDPSLLPQSLTLARRYPSLLSNIAFEEFCKSDLKKHEILDYFNHFELHSFLIHYPNDIKSELYTWHKSNHYNVNIFSTQYEYYHFGLTNMTNAEKTKDQIIKLIQTKDNIRFDLLTSYKILMNRKPCVPIDPKFAKNIVISFYNRVIDHLENGLPGDFNKIRRIFNVYCYLVGHIVIFNIDEKIYDTELMVQFDNNWHLPPGELLTEPIKTFLLDFNRLIDIVRTHITEL